jgi:hypothetical protein
MKEIKGREERMGEQFRAVTGRAWDHIPSPKEMGMLAVLDVLTREGPVMTWQICLTLGIGRRDGELWLKELSRLGLVERNNGRWIYHEIRVCR